MKTFKFIFLTICLIATPNLMAQEVIEVEDEQNDSIDYTEGMLENTDSLISVWNLNNFYRIDSIPQRSDNFDSIDKNVIIDRLKRIPCVMDLVYNDIVARYIEQYTTRLRYSVSYMLGISNFYVPIFEEALAYYNIPLELKYLPVIESAFNPRARSRVGAMGLWQFMPATAKRYGLAINSLVDERCDPIKSSYAAAKYLKDLYDIFNDWTLVIAAYNCGPNNVSKAIHRADGDNNYWKIYPYLPRETRGYVPAFIAANYAMNYYGDHGITPMHTSIANNTDTIVLNQDVRMEQIASVCDISVEELRALNPQYNTTLIPGYRLKSTLRMPQKQILAFIDAQDSIFVYNEKEAALAQQEQEKIEDIDKRVATKSSSRSRSRARSSSRSRSSRGSASYTIQKGQTLSEIARRNHTTVAKLRQLNGIKGNNIQAGKKLRVK